MDVTDSQIHIWAADTPTRPWPESGRGRAHLPEPFGAADALAEMNVAGVSRAVLVPPSWEGDRNDLVLEAAEQHPERFRAMVRVPLDEATGKPFLEGVPQLPGTVGARLVFSRDPARQLFEDGRLEWLWKTAQNLSIPIAVFAPTSFHTLNTVARRYPGVRFLIDHAGLDPSVRGDEIDRVLAELLPLADLDNVAVKLSSLPSYVDEPFPFSSLSSRVRRIIDAFSPRRVFWGSDLTRQPCPYVDSVRFATETLTYLSPEETRSVVDRGVREWIGWEVDADVSDPDRTEQS